MPNTTTARLEQTSRALFPLQDLREGFGGPRLPKRRQRVFLRRSSAPVVPSDGFDSVRLPEVRYSQVVDPTAVVDRVRVSPNGPQSLEDPAAHMLLVSLCVVAGGDLVIKQKDGHKAAGVTRELAPARHLQVDLDTVAVRYVLKERGHEASEPVIAHERQYLFGVDQFGRRKLSCGRDVGLHEERLRVYPDEKIALFVADDQVWD